VIGVSSSATPDDELTVWTTLPDGSSNTNCIGTLSVDSDAIETARVPAGNVTFRKSVWPADGVAMD